jgi:hypothetical protein
MEFNSRNAAIHVYLSLSSLLGSRAKVHTLKQLLEKTTVRVVQPNIATSTLNIILKTLENLRKSGFPDEELDIGVLDYETEDTEAKIDASVFKLYGLDQSEVNTIMQSLLMTQRYQEKVDAYFSKSL